MERLRETLGLGLQDAEEVLEAVLADEGIALHIEEEVIRCWRGQRLETEMLAERWQDLERERLTCPLLHLEPSLLAKPAQRHLINPMDRLVDRTGAEFRYGPDAGEVQPAGLVPAHPGDKAKMVVLATAGLADIDPAADAAVVDRVRVGDIPPTPTLPRMGGGRNWR